MIRYRNLMKGYNQCPAARLGFLVGRVHSRGCFEFIGIGTAFSEAN